MRAAAEAMATMVIGMEVETAIVVDLEGEESEEEESEEEEFGEEVGLLELSVGWVLEFGLLVVVVGLSGEEGEFDFVIVGVYTSFHSQFVVSRKNVVGLKSLFSSLPNARIIISPSVITAE
jgi:hypothetical protein